VGRALLWWGTVCVSVGGVVWCVQVDKGYKRLVGVNLEFFTQCTVIKPVEFGGSAELLDIFARYTPPVLPCDVDINGDLLSTDYTLEVNFYPLAYFALLNLFQFGLMVYVIFYSIVGAMSVGVIGIIYIINRLLTKLRNPPIFQSLNLFFLLAEAPTQGVLYGTIPCFAAIMFVWLWLQSNLKGGPFGSIDPVNKPSSLNFEGMSGSWLDSQRLDTARVEEYRMGRMGACFLILGLYGTFLVARLVIPDWSVDDREPDNPISIAKREILYEEEDEEELPPTTFFAPKVWKRASFVYSVFAFTMFIMLLWEFSFSSYYGTYQFQLMVAFKFLFMQVSNWFGAVLGEDLLVNQLETMSGLAQGLTGMGASTLSNFVLGYFVGLALGWAQGIFIDPAIDEFLTQWPRYQFLLKRQFRAKRRMTREEKAAEEQEWQEINESIELAAEGIEPVLGTFGGYSVGAVGYYLYPIGLGFMMLFYTECTIPHMYNISQNEMKYYALFSIYIIPFQMLQDVVVTNTMELVHGWKIYDYIAYQRYRFSVRDYRWILRNEMVDESIDQGMQTLDLMCFSSQYYFILTISGYASALIQIAIEMFVRRDYNPFGDPVLIYLIIALVVFLHLLQRLCFQLANVKIKRLGWRGLWVTKQIEGTVDDEVAAKLAVGEGRQADLEQERLELQALNSERFRHRFVERNKPWILQHLVELLTPETLKGPGPEGRPLVEYVRDVYAELLGLGEGQRRPGDRSDISDDEDDGMEERRRDWPSTPLVGTSLLIARLWLEKARKRRAFTMHIQGILQSNKEENCYICGRLEDQGVMLVCGLATNKEADAYAIDRLIAGFEVQYGLLERDANLWKVRPSSSPQRPGGTRSFACDSWQAYFRANAEFITRCNICMNKMEGNRAARDMAPPGGIRHGGVPCRCALIKAAGNITMSWCAGRRVPTTSVTMRTRRM
jgi:hypothetical protein